MNPTLGNLGSLEDPVSWFPVRKRAAFFDVDHTLVSGSTIRGFFDHFKRQVDDPHLLDAIRDLEKRSVTYTDHGALIVDCFRLLAGQNWENMMDIGQSWFQEFGQHTFVPAIEARVAQHRNNEDVIVFVSGSWMPCLKPIAQAVGAHHVLCCEPFIEDGILTGEIHYPVVGEGKVRAIREFTEGSSIDLKTSFAYGDHASDIPMFNLVGHPVVIGLDTVLCNVAQTHGWEMM